MGRLGQDRLVVRGPSLAFSKLNVPHPRNGCLVCAVILIPLSQEKDLTKHGAVFAVISGIQTLLARSLAPLRMTERPLRALRARARARRFRQESFGRLRLDEFHRTSSLRDSLPRSAGGTVRVPRRFWQRDRQTFCQTRKHIRRLRNWVVASRRSQLAHLDFALSPYR